MSEYEELEEPLDAAKQNEFCKDDADRQAAFSEGARYVMRVLGEAVDSPTAMPRKILVDHFKQRIRNQEQQITELRAQSEGIRPTVYDQILAERNRQDRKWGGPDHDRQHSDNDWLAYIVKHAGKAVKWPFDRVIFRRQMIRVAALAVAAVEVLDQKGAD